MPYPELNIFSILAILVSAGCLFILHRFVLNFGKRILRLEKKTVDLIESFSKLHDDVVNARDRAVKKEKSKISYMEGDIDLVRGGKKATFKAIYHPRKIQKK